MLLNLNHKDRIGKFIQYLLENDYEKVVLSFDDETTNINYLAATGGTIEGFLIRTKYYEFLPTGSIVQNFNGGEDRFVADIYPPEQTIHPCWQKVVERLQELGDDVDEVEFRIKPQPSARIHLMNGTDEYLS
jgi:hypothetical protein|nr:MAG TPA: hypothetical protein [Caudoviricetes sp.]